jgi:DNA-binding SARP family transcriptional activator
MAASYRRRHRPAPPEPMVQTGERASDSAHLREWYDGLAARLDEIEPQAVHDRERAIVPIISALRELCAAYSDCCVELEQQHRARIVSLKRERELRRDIRLVLEALAEQEPPERERSPLPDALSASGGPAEARGASAAGSSGWRRLQGFFRHELDALSQEAPQRTESAPARPPPRRRSRPSLAAYCLGSFHVYVDDQLVDGWNGHKAVSVLKYLLLHRRRRVPKDVLFELFWPGQEPEACRRNLHQAIYSLRHTLRRYRPRARYVLFEEDCYFLNEDMDVWIDAEAFSEYVSNAQRLEEDALTEDALVEYGKAVSLYHGHLFEESLYDDWLGVERERLRSEFRLAVGRLVDSYVDRAEFSAAVVLCQKALSLDRCDEDAHRRLMRCYEAQGQRHLALRQFAACAGALRADLNLAPDDATTALYERLKRAGGEG